MNTPDAAVALQPSHGPEPDRKTPFAATVLRLPDWFLST